MTCTPLSLVEVTCGLHSPPLVEYSAERPYMPAVHRWSSVLGLWWRIMTQQQGPIRSYSLLLADLRCIGAHSRLLVQAVSGSFAAAQEHGEGLPTLGFVTTAHSLAIPIPYVEHIDQGQSRRQSTTHYIYQYNQNSQATSGFEMWFGIGSQRDGCWFMIGHLSWTYRIPACSIFGANGPI